jgi:hypothetical protein
MSLKKVAVVSGRKVCYALGPSRYPGARSHPATSALHPACDRTSVSESIRAYYASKSYILRICIDFGLKGLR